MKWFKGLLMLACFLVAACSTTTKMAQKAPVAVSQADQIIKDAIIAHGGPLYTNAAFSFDFREKQYTFINKATSFEYIRKETKDSILIKDVLTNTGFTRSMDGLPTTLASADSIKYGNSLNSIIYFALLPYKLDDAAVQRTYKGITVIKQTDYHTIEITFGKEGGGVDHEDVFYYWINTGTNVLDYLAYQYQVNDGGVRFRQAVQPKIIDGIRFQNYINYKADKDTPLADLPNLFETGGLDTLSTINLDNIRGEVVTTEN